MRLTYATLSSPLWVRAEFRLHVESAAMRRGLLNRHTALRARLTFADHCNAIRLL
jgi:hypothetical protein